MVFMIAPQVREGHPAAQQYGLGSKWTTFKVGYIAGENSPAKKVGEGQ